MEFEKVVPKSVPINLLGKCYWAQRLCFFRKGAQSFLDKLHDFEVRTDDVWIVTLPKCGTTWMQELVWLILNNFDFDKAKAIDLEMRSPFIEFNFYMNPDGDDQLAFTEAFESPRLIKSHTPMPLLPSQLWTKKPKIIYVFRNPKDAAVSNYYFGRSLGSFGCLNKTADEYTSEFIETNTATGNFWNHVLEFYAIRNEPNIFYTSYEKMQNDLSQVVSEICTFLNKPINDSQMKKLLEHLSFKSMKANNKCNHLYELNLVRKGNEFLYEEHNFIRKGKVGGYKDDLSKEMIEQFDDWIKANLEPKNLTLEELLLLK